MRITNGGHLDLENYQPHDENFWWLFNFVWVCFNKRIGVQIFVKDSVWWFDYQIIQLQKKLNIKYTPKWAEYFFPITLIKDRSKFYQIDT